MSNFKSQLTRSGYFAGVSSPFYRRVRASLYKILVALFSLVTGCGISPGSSVPCPYILADENRGFSVELPCGLIYLGAYSAEGGAVWSHGYRDEYQRKTEISVTSPTLRAADPPTELGRSLRYEGYRQTNSGDLVLIAQGASSDSTGLLAFGQLVDGSILGVYLGGLNQSDAEAQATIKSISMDGTTGEPIKSYFNNETTPVTLCPATGGYVLVTGGHVFYDWTGLLKDLPTGTPVLHHNAVFFDEQWFVTPLSLMVSIYVDIAGEARLLTLVDKSDGICAEFTLSDGSHWSTCGGATELSLIPIGADVYVFDDNGQDRLVEASTGRATFMFPD